MISDMLKVATVYDMSAVHDQDAVSYFGYCPPVNFNMMIMVIYALITIAIFGMWYYARYEGTLE